MKKLLVTLTIAALAIPAFAQFVSGPRVQALLSIPSGGYIVPSLVQVTNVASPVPFRINGKSPLVLAVGMGSTNATTISNIYFSFQLSVDGSHWQGPLGVEWVDGAVDNKFPVTLIPAAGQQQALAFTNISGTVDMSSFNWLRLYSISNHNKVGADAGESNTLYITNLYMIQGNQ